MAVMRLSDVRRQIDVISDLPMRMSACIGHFAARINVQQLRQCIIHVS